MRCTSACAVARFANDNRVDPRPRYLPHVCIALNAHRFVVRRAVGIVVLALSTVSLYIISNQTNNDFFANWTYLGGSPGNYIFRMDIDGTSVVFMLCSHALRFFS